MLASIGLFLTLRPAVPVATSVEIPTASATPSPTPSPTPTGPQWSEWEDLGGSFTSAPSVASWGVNRLDVFAQAAGQTMLHQAYDDETWYPAADLGPAMWAIRPPWRGDRTDSTSLFAAPTTSCGTRPGEAAHGLAITRSAGTSPQALLWRRGMRTGWTSLSEAVTTRSTTGRGTGRGGVSSNALAETWKVHLQRFREART